MSMLSRAPGPFCALALPAVLALVLALRVASAMALRVASALALRLASALALRVASALALRVASALALRVASALALRVASAWALRVASAWALRWIVLSKLCCSLKLNRAATFENFSHRLSKGSFRVGRLGQAFSIFCKLSQSDSQAVFPAARARGVHCWKQLERHSP